LHGDRAGGGELRGKEIRGKEAKYGVDNVGGDIDVEREALICKVGRRYGYGVANYNDMHLKLDSVMANYGFISRPHDKIQRRGGSEEIDPTEIACQKPCNPCLLLASIGTTAAYEPYHA
jgi:hypothetical protein